MPTLVHTQVVTRRNDIFDFGRFRGSKNVFVYVPPELGLHARDDPLCVNSRFSHGVYMRKTPQ